MIISELWHYIQARAVNAVLDANSPITSVADALRILFITELNNRRQEVSGLEVTPRKDELTSEIRRRLNSMIDSKGRLTQLASTSSASPSLSPFSSHDRRDLQVFFPQSVTLAVEFNNPSSLFYVADLLLLASKLKLENELRRVQEQSIGAIVEFTDKQFPDPYSSESKVIQLAGPRYSIQSSPAGATNVQGSDQTSDTWLLVWVFSLANAASPPAIQNEILESLDNQRRQRHAARMLESMDTDKDGKVSIAESGLSQSDTDQDGTISTNEYVDAMLRRNPNARRPKLESPKR